MPNHIVQTIIVTGINTGNGFDKEPVVKAWAKATGMFDVDLVSAPTAVGHNFVQSFCIFPTGGGVGREPQKEHQKAVAEFCAYLAGTGLEYVALKWTDSEPAIIEHTSET